MGRLELTAISYRPTRVCQSRACFVGFIGKLENGHRRNWSGLYKVRLLTLPLTFAQTLQRSDNGSQSFSPGTTRLSSSFHGDLRTGSWHLRTTRFSAIWLITSTTRSPNVACCTATRRLDFNFPTLNCFYLRRT